MKVSKRQLKRIIREEKSKLLKEQYADDNIPPQTYRVIMLVAVKPGGEEYILNSIEDGMEFDEEAGEGIIEYSVDAVN